MENSVFYDLPNLIVCLFTVLIVASWAKLPSKFALLLALNCFIPFFLNDVLFSANYMPDQFKYFHNVFNYRNGLPITETSATVLNSSLMLAYLPLPMVVTITSLGFFNKFLFIILFGFLYKQRILTNLSAYFFLLYPSVVLYTGLSLRDPLITFFMIMTAFFAVKRNLFLCILFLVPLWLIKFQNFIIMLPVLFYILFNIDKKGLSPSKVVQILLIMLISLIALSPLLIPQINIHRINMFIDDGGKLVDVELISGIGNFIYAGLTSGIYFLIKPLLWEVSSFMQLIQAIENIIVGGILYQITRVAWKKDKFKLMFWLLFFIISMSIYGLVVFNYGSAARYRFPFILTYVIFVCYSCNIQSLRMNKNL
jgi:hypothetical protein